MKKLMLACLVLFATSALARDISFTWQPVGPDYEVTSYNIYRCDGAGCQPTQRISVAFTTDFVDGSAIPGSTYTYAVSCVNVSGEGPLSEPVTMSAFPPVPPAPAGLVQVYR